MSVETNLFHISGCIPDPGVNEKDYLYDFCVHVMKYFNLRT